MELATEHLRLSPFAPEDLLALIDGPEAFRSRFGLPAAEGLRDFIVSDEVSPAFLSLLKDSTGPDPWKWGFAVIGRASELVVGTAGFKGPPNSEGVVEIAYAIAPSYEGRGNATEAAGALVSFSRADPRVRKVCAHTLPERNASTRVLEKNGFEHAGTVDDPEDGTVWRWEHALGGEPD